MLGVMSAVTETRTGAKAPASPLRAGTTSASETEQQTGEPLCKFSFVCVRAPLCACLDR